MEKQEGGVTSEGDRVVDYAMCYMGAVILILHVWGGDLGHNVCFKPFTFKGDTKDSYAFYKSPL